MASVRRSRWLGRTRSRISCVPGSLKGMRPSWTDSSTDRCLSTPMTSMPWSAKERASGSPIRPSPTIAALRVIEVRLPAALAEVLPSEREHEARVVVQVAREESPRLLRDAVRPLEPAVLHPRRGLRDATRVEVEGGADSTHDRHLEALADVRHPLLLLRHADADPEHVRLRLVDLLDQRVLFLGGQRTEGWGVAADDLDALVALAQPQRELHEVALVAAAVEPDAVALGCAALRVAAHELGAVDAVGKVLAKAVRGPDQRHAVRHGQRGPEQRLAHLLVALGDHDGVDCNGADIARLAAGDHAVHDVHRLLVVGHGDREAEDLASPNI